MPLAYGPVGSVNLGVGAVGDPDQQVVGTRRSALPGNHVAHPPAVGHGARGQLQRGPGELRVRRPGLAGDQQRLYGGDALAFAGSIQGVHAYPGVVVVGQGVELGFDAVTASIQAGVRSATVPVTSTRPASSGNG